MDLTKMTDEQLRERIEALYEVRVVAGEAILDCQLQLHSRARRWCGYPNPTEHTAVNHEFSAMVAKCQTRRNAYGLGEE